MLIVPLIVIPIIVARLNAHQNLYEVPGHIEAGSREEGVTMLCLKVTDRNNLMSHYCSIPVIMKAFITS